MTRTIIYNSSLFIGGVAFGWLLFHSGSEHEEKISDLVHLHASNVAASRQIDKSAPTTVPQAGSDHREAEESLASALKELEKYRSQLRVVSANYTSLAKRFQKALKDIAPLWTPSETAEFIGTLQRDYFEFCKRFPTPPPYGSADYAEFEEMKAYFTEATNALVEAGDIPKMLGVDKPQTFSQSKAGIARASLGLSEVQTKQIESLYLRYYQEAQRLGLAWKTSDTKDKVHQSQQRQIMDSRFRQELRGLLSNDQLPVFETNFQHDGLWLTTFGDLAYQI